MKRLILGLALLVVGATAVQAQTTTAYNLQSSVADYIDYNTYANFFASDIPVMIGGVPFYVSINTHFGTDLQADPNYSSIQFWNQVNGERDNIVWAGSISTFANGPSVHPVIQGTFSGMIGGVSSSGSFVLTLSRHTRCYRYCQTYYTQDNGTLTLTQ